MKNELKRIPQESSEEATIAVNSNSKSELSVLSRKKRRKLRQTKNKPTDAANLTQDSNEPSGIKSADDEVKASNSNARTKKKRPGVWIGNLSFDASVATLKNFILRAAKERNLTIYDDNITSIDLPMASSQKCKGFARIFLNEPKTVDNLVALSESVFNGRNILVKSIDDFTGRPKYKTESGERKSGSIFTNTSTLFVGNLPFETSKEMLQDQFASAGDIRRIRLMTFEDSGKCKGFAFIDFHELSSTKYVMTRTRRYQKFEGKVLTLQYGEDRSKRSYIPQSPQELGGQ